MAWWDYGYQIAGIANRTSIADGNTWNHEHIANLARALTATEEKAHRVIRHLADYVLVWSGGGADDMAKSRTCSRREVHRTRHGTVDMHEIQSKFGIDQYGRPTPLMAQSLLFKLVSFQGGVSKERFEEVYTSKYRKVRIYKVVNVSESPSDGSRILPTDCATRRARGTARDNTRRRSPSLLASSSPRTPCPRSRSSRWSSARQQRQRWPRDAKEDLERNPRPEQCIGEYAAT